MAGRGELELTGPVFRREFMAEFVRDDLSAFDAELVEEAIDAGVAAVEADWAEYAKKRLR